MTDAVAMALATGFLGGFGHCIGMCGPLVGAMVFSAGGPAAAPAAGGRAAAAHALKGQLAYHAGRITTYTVLGGVLGLTGAFVNVAGRLAGFSQAVAVVAGFFMILLGLGASGASALLKQLEAAASGKLMRKVRGVLGAAPGSLYPAGLALGFLPCGLSWTAFLGAAGTGSLGEGLALSLAFGLGTLPALLAAGVAGAWLSVRARGVLYRLGGVLVAAMGVLFVWRGLHG
ncbi:MAG: sulfite exporter TauE/SafE family protein [Anaeromyxobacter sp.]